MYNTKEPLYNNSFFVHITKNEAICSFIEISRDSSTNIEKNPLSRSLMMALDVSCAIAFTMSFWISPWISLQFFRAFCNTSLIDSLWSHKIVETQENFFYHLNLEIHRKHEKLIPDIKGILCDVGQNLLINFCSLLYLVFLCNFRYFRFRAFISLFFWCF